MNWDDLRFFLELYRAGTLSATARVLGVNHATVGRRIDALSAEAGGALFRKTPDGFTLTAQGEALLPNAMEAEVGILGVQRVMRAADHSLSGSVRVATSYLLAHILLIPAAAELVELHPGIEIDVIEGMRVLSLAKQEADIGLRIQATPAIRDSNDVHVSYLGAMAWGVFGSSEFLRQHELTPAPTNLDGIPVITYDEDAPAPIGEKWLRERTTKAPTIVMRSNSLLTVRSAISQHLGLGFLPRAWGDCFGLTMLDTVTHAHVHLAIHPDLNDSVRIRTVYDHIVDHARRARHVFDD